MTTLRGDSLTKRYGQKEVVHSIDLEVNPAEVVGLLGRQPGGRGHYLDRHVDVETQVSAPVDGRHSALTELLVDHDAAENLVVLVDGDVSQKRVREKRLRGHPHTS